MFYFTCNESKIYESFTFWNKLQEKMYKENASIGADTDPEYQVDASLVYILSATLKAWAL